MPIPPLQARTLGIPHRGMLSHRSLPALLAPARLVAGERRCREEPLDALLAWGHRPSARRAERLAEERGLPLWRVEEGFLRSLGKGPSEPPLSLLLDERGIHYDAGGPSRLEALIASPHSTGELARAESLRRLWCEQRVSKLNPTHDSPVPEGPFVLVVDQTAGDLSIGLGQAGPESFTRMLTAALAENPQSTVVLRVHPDVVQGRRRGHFRSDQLRHPRLRLSADGGHPSAQLAAATAVYVVTSQLGFEALLWGKPVHCFGMPFYAGWGLSQDRLPAPRRRVDLASAAPGPRRVEDLVHAALIGYSRWIDPHLHSPCAVEDLIEAIGRQRRQRGRWPARIDAFGFTPWKQQTLRRYLAGSQIRFHPQHGLPPRRGSNVAIWGRRAGWGVRHWQRRRWLAGADPEPLHVEDGFLRSVGLGADLITPLSWVIDRRGIYYDATAPSDLENLLSKAGFSEGQRQRAGRLRQRLVEQEITKYNLIAPPWRRPDGVERVVLVPGQVESDASIRFGTPGIRSNLDLLRAVRRAEPAAYLLYKPHPDVVAGLCRQGRQESQANLWCDEVLVEASIQQLFNQVDALHVLTSIAGFEALLRGLPVHTWGLPFYAGWGLTQDRHHCERRGRPLQLDELVYAALIAYPTYVSRHSGWFLPVEQALDELQAWRALPPQPLTLRQRIFRHWGRLSRR